MRLNIECKDSREFELRFVDDTLAEGCYQLIKDAWATPEDRLFAMLHPDPCMLRASCCTMNMWFLAFAEPLCCSPSQIELVWCYLTPLVAALLRENAEKVLCDVEGETILEVLCVLDPHGQPVRKHCQLHAGYCSHCLQPESYSRPNGGD